MATKIYLNGGNIIFDNGSDVDFNRPAAETQVGYDKVNGLVKISATSSGSPISSPFMILPYQQVQNEAGDTFA